MALIPMLLVVVAQVVVLVHPDLTLALAQLDRATTAAPTVRVHPAEVVAELGLLGGMG